MQEPKEVEPKSIAEYIFSQPPKEPCSIGFLSDPDEGSNATLVFEILLTIFMEGLEIKSGGLKNYDMNNFSAGTIESLSPWFISFGFMIYVSEYDRTDKQLYCGYYNRIILNNEINSIIFEMRGIKKNYHFFTNGDALEENRGKSNLKDISAIFEHNNKVYVISFDTFNNNGLIGLQH